MIQVNNAQKKHIMGKKKKILRFSISGKNANEAQKSKNKAKLVMNNAIVIVLLLLLLLLCIDRAPIVCSHDAFIFFVVV